MVVGGGEVGRCGAVDVFVEVEVDALAELEFLEQRAVVAVVDLQEALVGEDQQAGAVGCGGDGECGAGEPNRLVDRMMASGSNSAGQNQRA